MIIKLFTKRYFKIVFEAIILYRVQNLGFNIFPCSCYQLHSNMYIMYSVLDISHMCRYKTNKKNNNTSHPFKTNIHSQKPMDYRLLIETCWPTWNRFHGNLLWWNISFLPYSTFSEKHSPHSACKPVSVIDCECELLLQEHSGPSVSDTYSSAGGNLYQEKMGSNSNT